MLAWVDRQLARLSSVIAIIGAVSIVVLMMVTLVAVFFRYVLQDPIFGISDISVLTLAVVAASSVAFGARHDAHVSVDVIRFFAGPKITRVTDVIMRLLSICVLLLAAWALVIKACGFEKACITDNLSIEHRPFFYVLAIAMVFFALQILWQLLSGDKAQDSESSNVVGQQAANSDIHTGDAN